MIKNGEKNNLSEKIRANIMSSSNSNLNSYISSNSMNISSSSTISNVSSSTKELNHISHSGISEKKRSSFATPIKNPYWPDNLWKDGAGNLIYCYKNPEKCLGPPNVNKSDKTIRFNSRFESGNLLYAFKLNPDVYHCIIDADNSPNEQCQWFYFQMSNIQTLQNFNRKITFYISGFNKESSIISNGWKVFMYSERLARIKNISWFRTGTNYAYGRSFKQDSSFNLESKSSRRKKPKNNPINTNCYTLQFQITFPYDDDVVYLCYGIPYTYADLNSHITRWTQSSSSLMTCTTLCKTRAGKNCPLLTITAPNSPKGTKKRCIFLTARNHPGESNASLILHGLIDFLFSKQPSSEFLLHHFIFKIVPMINVDGVIDGSHHIGHDGENMNRNWNNPDPYKHPVVYHTKNLLGQIEKEIGIAVFIDFHGCSSEHGTFLLGCPYSDDENLPISCINKEKIFPKILDSLCDSFSLEKCRFPLPRRRNEHPRSVVRKEFGVVNSFTLKSSFGGSTDGIWANSLYSECNWKEIGAKVAESLFHLLSVEKPSYLLKSVENSKTFSNSSSPKSKSANSSFEYSDSYRNSPIKMNSKEEILAEMKRKAEADEDATVIAIETEDGIKIISGNSNLNSKLNVKKDLNSNSNFSPSQQSKSFYNSDSNSGFSRLGFRSESNLSSSFSLNSSSNSSFAPSNRVGLNSGSNSNSTPNPRTKSIRNTSANYSPGLNLSSSSNSRFSSNTNSDSNSKYQPNTTSNLNSYLASRTNYSVNSNTNSKPLDSSKSITITKNNSLLSSASDSKSNSNLFLSSDSNSSARFGSSSKSNLNSDSKPTSTYNTNSDNKTNQTIKRSQSPQNSYTSSYYNINQSNKRDPSPQNSNTSSETNSYYKINQSIKRDPSPQNSNVSSETNSYYKTNQSIKRSQSPQNSNTSSETNSYYKINQSIKRDPSPQNSNVSSETNSYYKTNLSIKRSQSPQNSSTSSEYKPNQSIKRHSSPKRSRSKRSPSPKHSRSKRSSSPKNSNSNEDSNFSPKQNSSSRYNSNIRTKLNSDTNSEVKPNIDSKYNTNPQSNTNSSNDSNFSPSQNYNSNIRSKINSVETNADIKPSLTSKYNPSPRTNYGSNPNSKIYSSPIKSESNSEVKPPNPPTKVYSSPKPIKSESSSEAKPSLLSKFNSSSDSNSGLIQRPNSSLKSSSNYSSSRPLSRTKLSAELSDFQQSENSSFLNANECTSSWSSFQSNSTASFPSATSFKSPFTTSNKRVTFQSDIYQKKAPKRSKAKDS